MARSLLDAGIVNNPGPRPGNGRLMQNNGTIQLGAGLAVFLALAAAQPVLAAVQATDDVVLPAWSSSMVLGRFGYPAGDSRLQDRQLDAYVREALAANPRLETAWSEVEALEASANLSSALPDPRLAVTGYIRQVETRVGPQNWSFSLTQSFPWFGTLGLREEAADERTRAARAAFDGIALEIITAVKTAYYELVYREQAQHLTEQHIALVQQWEEAARARYASGQGSYADLVKVQVELGMLGDTLAGLRDRRRPLSADLNALLDRRDDVEIKTLVLPPAVPLSLGPGQLTARLLADNPQLMAWDHRGREYLAAGELAGKQGYPGFFVGLNYILTGEARMPGVAGSGTDALMATVGMTLPIWRGKYEAAGQEAASRYQAAAFARRERANALGAELQTYLFRYREAARKLELYGTTLVAMGRQSLQAVQSAFESGSSGFLDLVDARRMLLEFELSAARAAIDLRINQAEIERLVAGPLQP